MVDRCSGTWLTRYLAQTEAERGFGFVPWREVSIVGQRKELVEFAQRDEVNMSGLCRQAGISRQTGYKWRERYEREGEEGLKDRSRRPLHSPGRTKPELEARVLAVREANPVWGGRKIRGVLLREGLEGVPSASTITEILRRHGKMGEREKAQGPYRRFEHERPNDLWQMDFKGWYELERGKCHPLTILDDHSRFSVGLYACLDEREETVRARLCRVFRRYGLPRRMTMDNGSPWGSGGGEEYTRLAVWLLELGIRVSHSRPYHPQTQGKDERFHRTLKAEVLSNRVFRDVEENQARFDVWREVYNWERPHDALGLEVPGSRYQPSQREYPECWKAFEYAPGDEVRKVQGKGEIHFHGQIYKVGKAFHGKHVALRPTCEDGQLEIYFCQQRVGILKLGKKNEFF